MSQTERSASLIALRNIVKQYHLGQTIVPALQGVDLQVARGEFTVVMGPSGSGKSTLLNIIGCLDSPTSGTYLFDGQEVSNRDFDKLAELRKAALDSKKPFDYDKPIEGLKALDRYTIQFKLGSPRPRFIGTLAGGIAHDFNNLLQAIFANISMARQCYDSKEESLHRLESVEQSLHLAIKLTGQLLAFSKGASIQKRKLALGPLIREATSFILSGAKASCSIHISSVSTTPSRTRTGAATCSGSTPSRSSRRPSCRARRTPRPSA